MGRPSFGRTREERGDDLFDTPPIALAPLFAHEPLLAGVAVVCEPFCDKGNLVVAMRERGLTVFASDISDRGCLGSTVRDFRAMTERAAGLRRADQQLRLCRRYGLHRACNGAPIPRNRAPAQTVVPVHRRTV
jgi:hypothetical protein